MSGNASLDKVSSSKLIYISKTCRLYNHNIGSITILREKLHIVINSYYEPRNLSSRNIGSTLAYQIQSSI